MEWEAVERQLENDWLSAALAKLIDRNWSQDKKLDNALDRVWELEDRVKGTEDALKESHINQTALNVKVVITHNYHDYFTLFFSYLFPY